jgi:oxaloacetate decarboxylase alpha subunit
VTDEVLLYALGFWGEEEAASIEANLKDRLLQSPRARELARLRVTEMSASDFREKFAGANDDDKLLNFFAGAEAVAALKAAGAPKDFGMPSTSLVQLIEQIGQRKGPLQVYIKRDGLTLNLARRR